jgi:hypothetical protein
MLRRSLARPHGGSGVAVVAVASLATLAPMHLCVARAATTATARNALRDGAAAALAASMSALPHLSGNSPLAPSLRVARRGVQFRRTSEMLTAVNGTKADREKWVTKSTADFAERLKIAKEAGIKTSPSLKPGITTLLYEADSKQTATATAISSSDAKGATSGVATPGGVAAKAASVRAAKEDDPRIRQHREDFERNTYEHWTRIASFKAARGGRFKTYFAEHGWGFFTFYCFIYALGFVAIYLILKLKILDYRGIFEYIFCIAGGSIERTPFFDRMADVNPQYVDMAFAAMLNEGCDAVRFPLAVLWFLALRRWWTRQPGKTMFRDFMPEKGMTFAIKMRDEARRRMMREASASGGGTVATAARATVKR